MAYERGWVAAVTTVPIRSALTAPAAAGATVLHVEDPTDFPEDGGRVLVGGTIYRFAADAADEDAGTLTITPGLVAAAAAEDWVELYDPNTRKAATEQVVTFTLDGDEDGDTLEARIPQSRGRRVGDGVRAERAEQVVLEQDGDEWLVKEFIGSDETSFSAKTKNANQPLADGTWTDVAFPAAGDEDIDYDIGGRFWTITTEGIYLLFGAVHFVASDGGIREVRWLRERGGTSVRLKNTRVTNPHATAPEIVDCNLPERLEVDDVLRLQARQTSGGNLDINSDGAGTLARIVRL